MPKLPKELNPLYKPSIYQELHVEASSSTEELKMALENFSVDSLKSKKNDEEIEQIKKSIALLKQNFTRVTVNSLILEKVELKKVNEYLKQLPNFKKGQVRLPKPDLSQVHIEGQSVEISQQDFQSVDKDPSLELDFNELKDHLKPQEIDKHYYFET